MGKLLSSVILFFGLSTLAMAKTDPSVMLKDIAAKMISVIETNKEAMKNDETLADKLVRDHLLPHLDTEAFSRRTLGSKIWKSLNPTQQTEFTNGYIDRVIEKYAKGLSLYDGQAFEFESTEFSKRNPKNARVKSSMKQEGAAPFGINYRLSNSSGRWLINNIIVEGTDMRKSYKQQFLPRIKEVGIEKFIEELNAPVK